VVVEPKLVLPSPSAAKRLIDPNLDDPSHGRTVPSSLTGRHHASHRRQPKVPVVPQPFPRITGSVMVRPRIIWWVSGRISVDLLGGFSVALDGTPVPREAWRSRRAADLVKLPGLAPRHRLHW